MDFSGYGRICEIICYTTKDRTWKISADYEIFDDEKLQQHSKRASYP
jgi:hypothetical protein